MKVKWAILACLMCSIITAAIVWSLSPQVVRIQTTCTIKTVGAMVYANQNCTIPVTSIDWGIMEPGETKGTTVFIRNEGNVPSTLNITTEDWQPTNASQYITFSNDYNGSELTPMQVVQVLFTLSIEPSISGIKQFSFVILVIISG